PSTGQAFVQECQHLLHAQAHLGLEQVIMRLDLRAPLTPQTRKAPGRLRRAWMEDFNVLRGWAQAMVLELKLYEAPHETAEVIRRAVEGRRYFVWDNGGPVAMFGHSGHTPHGARINSVYVPPAHRGRGYATAGVWQLSELLRQSGKSFACLFADRHNPQTIRMYEKLGYKIIGALDETRFVHGE
ncbi:MAG: GNAT family N-acetyltransferase, partial [Bdellovibrionaceae bacterium]|nr:GNAT family N-acetyltransferase [Pseudobdellovibrionaceae bacterium]